MDEKLFRPIQEASYLTAGNAGRYRTILRYMYEQHERLRHYLFPEEIHRELKQSEWFADYTAEQLQQDLDQLAQWKNVVPRQETGRVSSIEEFKRKKFRYQLTPYTIEIERMVIGLEQLGDGFGGSLERTLFDRLLQNLLKLTALVKNPVSQELTYDVLSWEGEQLNRLWQDIYDDFRKLTESATDYLAHLQSEKVEEKMMTEAFLSYKDAVTEYLRNFMSTLQRSSFRIEAILEETKEEIVSLIAAKVADYELSIPRIDERPDKDQLVRKLVDHWQVLRAWFIGSETAQSDMMYLQNATNETIRRLTRFAQRLGESHNNMRSRRMDYMHLAKWFAAIDEVEEAHELSACVFGVMHTRHLFVDVAKMTESIDTEVWDEPAFELPIRPRVQTYREKQRPNSVIDRHAEKENMLRAYLLQKQVEQEQIDALMDADRIVFADLPMIDTHIRKTLLQWIARSVSTKSQTGQTESGRKFKLLTRSKQTITLRAEDGSLDMPDYMLQFYT